MKRSKILIMTLLALLVSTVLLVTSCGEKTSINNIFDKTCEHVWSDATCTAAKTCTLCSETEGEALGHTWADATCSDPKTCSVCAETEGEALGHTWVDATCTVAKTCSVCAETEGESLGHTWINATCTAPKTCSVCAEKEGEALGHSYSESIVSVATCNQEGVKKFTCTQCADSYSENYSKITYSANELYEMTKASIGEIITYDKSGKELALGTGFVYTADGKVITNYHVIDKAYSAKIKINDVTYTVKYVLAYDKAIDLAILKIDANGLVPVQICKNQHAVGKTVYAFGSSKGLTATFSQGIITYASREVDGVLYVQHDAAISGGNSGGPLIDQYGEVIGINTWTVKDSQNLNFAIATTEIDNLVYGKQLTFSEFYEKECDVFTKIKNMAISKGTYSSSDKEYTLTLGYSYSDDYTSKYTRIVVYDVADDNLYLLFYINSSSFVMISINDELDGVYFWGYADSAGYQMQGTLYANTYTSSSLLGVSSHNIKYSSLITSTRKLASAMVNVLCLYLDDDFKSIGVSAEDLGFLYY